MTTRDADNAVEGELEEVRVLRSMLVEQAKRLHDLERELQGFLEQYFAAIAADIETLVTLERQRGDWFDAHMPEMKRMQERLEEAGERARKHLARDAYRKAAKQAHPDAGDTRGDMRHINRAKEENDIATLLSAALPDAHATDAKDELESWRGKLEESTRALLDSPAYALYLKAFEARLAGRNWLKDMSDHIKRQVEDEQRAIAKRNIEAIADWRVAG